MTAEELFKQKKKAKAQARRDRSEENASLGMTSLMDIVSIIVVYLLKSYASDPVLIMPVADQKIPMSPADMPIQEGQPLYVTTKEIIFNEKKLVQLVDGEVNPNEVQNHLIGTLYDALAEEADKGKQMAESRQEEWPARIILIGDERLKFSTLVDVMYTAGKAEFAQYAFCVIKRSA